MTIVPLINADPMQVVELSKNDQYVSVCQNMKAILQVNHVPYLKIPVILHLVVQTPNVQSSQTVLPNVLACLAIWKVQIQFEDVLNKETHVNQTFVVMEHYVIPIKIPFASAPQAQLETPTGVVWNQFQFYHSAHQDHAVSTLIATLLIVKSSVSADQAI